MAEEARQLENAQEQHASSGAENERQVEHEHSEDDSEEEQEPKAKSPRSESSQEYDVFFTKSKIRETYLK